MNAKGIIVRQIGRAPGEAMDLLTQALKQNGATIYARINQQQEALKAGINMLPLEFLLFGNPVKGGQLMTDNPLTALDLPLKVIAWQDNRKQNLIAFNDAKYLAGRYGLRPAAAQSIDLLPLISKLFN